MPTLFDSHDEFNEWFSKDIESHAENKTGIDESRWQLELCSFTIFLSDNILLLVICFSRTFVEAAYDLEAVHVEEDKEGR